MATYFPRWIDGRSAMRHAAEQLGCTRDGMLAPLAVVVESCLVKMPPHVSLEEAATLPCAAVTAWSALTGPRPVLPGETVLTVGPGGVALFALQFAWLFGARVTAVTSGGEKAGRLGRLGADAVVSRNSPRPWSLTVRGLTDGRGVDHMVETGGPDTFPHSIACTAEEGSVNLVAALGAGALDVGALRNPVGIRRIHVGSRARLEEMNRAICQHALHPVIDRAFAFTDAREALACFQARTHFGKIVVTG